MANVFIEASTMTAIGDAIRAKTGGMAQIYPKDMPAQIASITTGGSGDGSDLVRYVTFLDEDGSELFKMPVLVGDDCKDPVTHGDIDTPTKESTNTQNFTHSGWTSTVGGNADSNILKNITADKTVYVAYAVSTRYYTVTFYANDALFETVQVTYGGTATPSKTPTKDGYGFGSWNPSPTNVTADMDCYAVWTEGIKFATASWAKIAEISEAGEAEQYFKLGDSKEFTYNGSTYSAIIIGFGLDDLADGTGKAGITCRVNNSFTSSYTSGGPTTGYWSTCKTRTDFLANAFYSIEADLRNVIKPVNKKSMEGTSYVTVADKLWVFSVSEIGYNFPNEGTLVYPIFTSGKEPGKSTKYDDLSAVFVGSCKLRSASTASSTYHVINGYATTTTSTVNKNYCCFCV